MLHILVGVREKGEYSYYRRGYSLPPFVRIVNSDTPVEGSSSKSFERPGSCRNDSEVLAEKLFQIPGVRSVKMERHFLTVTAEEGTNGPQLDSLVIGAIRKTIEEQLTMGIQWLDMEIPAAALDYIHGRTNQKTG